MAEPISNVITEPHLLPPLELPVLISNNLSSIFVLDQDQAPTFYTNVLGLEVVDDVDFGPMRWLTVRGARHRPRHSPGAARLPGPR